MRKIFFLLNLVLMVLQAAGQTNPPLAGEYMLYGEMETAAGFKLDSNGRFQFFFSYGALDRQASGIWKKEGDQLVLNSDAKGTNDFQLTQSKKGPGKQITVYVSGAPPEIMRYITLTGVWKDKQASGTANEKGRVVLPLPHADSLLLQFQWCPEKTSKVAVDSALHNQFYIRMLPSITDVLFDNSVFNITENEISGVLPFSGEHICHFRRTEASDQTP